MRDGANPSARTVSPTRPLFNITFGYSGFLVGRCELSCGIPFPSPSYDSRSGLVVKGSLRRVKRAPLTAPGRS